MNELRPVYCCTEKGLLYCASPIPTRKDFSTLIVALTGGGFAFICFICVTCTFGFLFKNVIVLVVILWVVVRGEAGCPVLSSMVYISPPQNYHLTVVEDYKYPQTFCVVSRAKLSLGEEIRLTVIQKPLYKRSKLSEYLSQIKEIGILQAWGKHSPTNTWCLSHGVQLKQTWKSDKGHLHVSPQPARRIKRIGCEVSWVVSDHTISWPKF